MIRGFQIFTVTTPTTTLHNQQQNLNTEVGLDTKMTVQTPPHPTTETQQLLTATKYNMISNNNINYNNNNNNNNDNKNNINNNYFNKRTSV